MIRPHLEYGNSIWWPRYRSDIVKVERVQRRITRLISGLKDIPYQERLRALNLPSLQYRRRRGNMIVMYKILDRFETTIIIKNGYTDSWPRFQDF